MKILVDTNVILDVILHRDPFYDDSRAVYNLFERRKCTGCVSYSTITDIFYLARKELTAILPPNDRYKVYNLLSYIELQAMIWLDISRIAVMKKM